MRQPITRPEAGGPFASRVAFAAAHVVHDPWSEDDRLDWDATLRFRHHLWSLGFGVAEAMDTSQRGMGLEWPDARELIIRSGAEARASGARIACGAGTDQLTGPVDLAAVIAAYEEQIAVVEDTGSQVIIMASPALASTARGAEDYHAVYARLLSQVARPVILHWLGPKFLPSAEGYWGSADLDTATESLLGLIKEWAPKVDGVKLSLLDAEREQALRRVLPDGVRMYTGDDFNYPDLILGDDQGHSDALLGIFDPIAPAAATALRALDAGDEKTYAAALAPTLPVARHLFAAPTYHYKTGVVFLSWLAGHQDNFTMVGGRQSARSLRHLVRAFVLADQAGLLPDPDLAAARMQNLLAVAGFRP